MNHFDQTTVTFLASLITLNINQCWLPRSSSLEYVKAWKYLGANVVMGDSSTGWLSLSVDLSKFYRSFYSILHCSMKLSEKVLMKLLYSNCVTALTYAAKVRQPSATEMRSMNTAIGHTRLFPPIEYLRYKGSLSKIRR